jgi:hypothetical protein
MSHKNSVLGLTVAVLLAALSLPVGTHSEDRAKPGLAVGIQPEDSAHCSNATMHGSYGFHATGRNFVAIGRFVFDGHGGLTGELFVRVPGTNVGPIEISGTYSVGPDCIMTDDWGGPNPHISAIVDQGKGYFIMNVTPSTPEEDGLNNGEGRRQ